MDRVILLHFSWSVTEQFELVVMRRQVLTFLKRPSFNDLVARVRVVMNVECDVRLYRRYDMGDVTAKEAIAKFRWYHSLSSW
jgi:hypothetical protein